MAKKLNIVLGDVTSDELENVTQHLETLLDAKLDEFENELGIKVSSFSFSNTKSKKDGIVSLHIKLTVNDDVQTTAGKAMGKDKYSEKELVQLVKHMLTTIVKDENILESATLTEDDKMELNELTGNVTYKVEVLDTKAKEADYVGGAEQFHDALSDAIKQHIETSDEELKEVTGADVYCQSVQVTEGKAVVNLQLKNPEDARNILAQEVEQEPELVTDEDVLLFIGEVITDVDDKDLRISFVQIPDGEEEVINYFVFDEDVEADDLVVDKSTIRLTTTNSEVVKATEA